jgi:hypothetical protein
MGGYHRTFSGSPNAKSRRSRTEIGQTSVRQAVARTLDTNTKRRCPSAAIRTTLPLAEPIVTGTGIREDGVA